jgi:hypothetical protein
MDSIIWMIRRACRSQVSTFLSKRGLYKASGYFSGKRLAAGLPASSNLPSLEANYLRVEARQPVEEGARHFRREEDGATANRCRVEEQD